MRRKGYLEKVIQNSIGLLQANYDEKEVYETLKSALKEGLKIKTELLNNLNEKLIKIGKKPTSLEKLSDELAKMFAFKKDEVVKIRHKITDNLIVCLLASVLYHLPICWRQKLRLIETICESYSRKGDKLLICDLKAVYYQIIKDERIYYDCN